MKPILSLIILLFGASLFTNAQSKLLAISTYHHDSTGFFLNDSIGNFYKPANTTFATQLYDDALVSSTTDSNLAYNNNAGTIYLASKSVYSYNLNYTQVTKYLGYLYDNLGVNTYKYQTDYYYNGLQLDSSIGIYTNVIPNNTYKYYNTFYHYNGLNQMDTTWIIYFTNLGVYSSSLKQVKTYIGNNLAEIMEYKSTDSIIYTPDSKYNYYYNLNNNTDSVVYFHWMSPSWIKVAKNEFTYNANNLQIMKEYFGFNNATQTYDKTARDQYLRNNNNEMDTVYSQLWNQAAAMYDTTVKTGYKYQGGVLLHAYGFNKNVNNMWQPNPYDGIRNFYYDVVPSKINEIRSAKMDVSIFPNPAEHILQLKNDYKGSKYYIATIEGKYVQSGLVDPKNQVQIDLLAGGVYIILIQSQTEIARAKFIKL